MDIKTMNAQDIACVIEDNKNGPSDELLAAAAQTRDKYYGREIFVRGLIEFTN